MSHGKRTQVLKQATLEEKKLNSEMKILFTNVLGSFTPTKFFIES